MILLDASGLLAAWDTDATDHEAARLALVASRPPRLLSPFVLAELDYLFAARLGHRRRSEFLTEVSLGAFRLAHFATDDIADAKTIVDRYADLGVSLADASIVLLAHRHRATTVLTLDQRHFRVLQGPGEPFRILPADA